MKQTKFFAMAVAALLLLAACGHKTQCPDTQDMMSTDNIYQFSVLSGAGDTVNLAVYQGKVLLVVNTATQCGFTPQYEALQSLYSRFHDRGFEILDFPCNQFGEQAPGSNEEIHAFCTGTFGTTFPQMAKINVNGDSAAALYVWLKEQAPFGGFDTTNRIGAYLDQAFRAEDPDYDKSPDIKWNFTKFLIDRDGNVVRRFEPYEGYVPVEAALKQLL